MASTLTNGWDLVAAVTQGSLNPLVAQAFAAGDIPSTINEPLNMGILGTAQVSVNITAPTVDLNPLASQGQSGFVGVIFPITGGTLTIGTGPAVPIPAGSFEVITLIRYISVDFSGGTNEKLSLDFNSPLAIYNVTINEPTWQPEQTEIIALGVSTALKALAPDAFSLGHVTIPTALAMLAPVGNADFAIQVASDPNMNTLLLCAVTASGTAPTGAGATDFSKLPPLLTAGQPAALYVSNRMFIQEIVVPQMAPGLGLSASNFSFLGDANTPYTATFSGDQSIPNGGSYDPEITDLAVYVNNSQQVQGAYTVHAHPLFNAGATFYVEVDGNIYVNMVLTGQTISFNSTADSGSGSIKASAWGWVIVVAAIIASFGTIGAFLAGVLAIVVPIVITQLKFPVTLPSSLLTNIDTALVSFTWPAQTNFPLSAVNMPGDLVFVGTPQI